NAGIQIVNGQVQPTQAVGGRILDVDATIAQLRRNAGAVLADGMLELVMQTVQPTVTDSTPALEQARNLLANPLDIRIFDPVTGDSVYWSVQPNQWAQWLTTTPDANSASGFSLTANDVSVRDYLTQQANAVLDTSRYLKMDEAVANVQQTISQGQANP